MSLWWSAVLYLGCFLLLVEGRPAEEEYGLKPFLPFVRLRHKQDRNHEGTRNKDARTCSVL